MDEKNRSREWKFWRITRWPLVVIIILVLCLIFLPDRIEEFNIGKGLFAIKFFKKEYIEAQKNFIPEDFREEVARLSKIDPQKAIENYQKLQNQIFGIDVYKVMSYNYFLQGRFEETIGEVRKVLSLATESKDSSWAYNNWGAALLNLGRYVEAIEKFEKAVEIDPKYGGAYSNWGVALVKLGRNKEAIEKFEKAVEINPKYAKYGDAYSNWGAALVNLGRNEEAIEKFQKAAEINTKDAEVYYNWGVALLNLGRNGEAIEKFEMAVKIDSGFVEAYSSWGAALGYIGRYEEAIEKFKKTLEINPKYVKAYYNLALVYSVLNNKDGALKNLKKAIGLDQKWKEKAKTDKNFDKLRHDPEFKKIVGE